MKLRLHGTRAEVAEATRRLGQVLEVVAVSPPHPDRGASVLFRVYLEVRLELPDASGSTGAPPGGPPDPSGHAAQADRRRHPDLGGRWSR
jgi:hypothetical protein